MQNSFYKYKIIAVCGLLLFLFSSHAQAQIKAVPRATMLKATKTVQVLKLNDFKKTDLYAARVRLYRATFTNPSKSFIMADGTSMSIHFIKNPSFANNSDNVVTQLTSGPIHGRQVPVNAVSESNVGFTDYHPYHGRGTSNVINFKITDDDSKQMSQHVFPGAVFTFDNFMNGTYQPPAGARNSIMLGTDHATSVNFVSVANPNPANIHSAVQNTISHFTGPGNPQTSYKYFESNNMADWTTKVNVGGTANGTNLNLAFNTTDRTHHRFITIDVTRELYSIFTNPPSDGFYSTTNSTEATPNLMVVGSVNYGVRLLVNLELTFATNADAVEFKNKLSYEVYTNNLDMNFLQSHVSEITGISAYEIGGTHSGIVFINKTNLKSDINNVLSGVNNQNAKPISFELYDMAWDVIGAYGTTGNFSYVNRMPAPPPPPSNPTLTSGSLSVTCGSDGKNHSSNVWIALLSPQNKEPMLYVDENNTVIISGKAWPANATVTLPFPTSDCNCGPFHLNDFTDIWRVTLDMVSGTFKKDDIKDFSLTLTLNYKEVNGQNTNHTVTWHNLNFSSSFNGGSKTLNLPFKYSNNQFIALQSYLAPN